MEQKDIQLSCINGSGNANKTECITSSSLMLAAPDSLTIIGLNGEKYIGGKQEWYEDRWQRMSGCGPVVASNLIWYMTREHGRIEYYLKLMHEMFTFVTPGKLGVNTSAIFSEGIVKYGLKNGLHFDPKILDIAPALRKRPCIDTVREFITGALQMDAPVAFLNLSNGSLDNLETWHWVTIIALDAESMHVEVCDYGKKVVMDMSEWLRTSRLGGALVYLMGYDVCSTS